ncbi:MAG: hypothetical protein FWD47_14690 [Treponema sp.]|nr:hypothetical protein [Treponema sp.]
MKYKSEAFAVLHENAVAMYKVGGITETSMREYDEMCLKNCKKEIKSSPAYNDDITVKHKQIRHATV